jgi:putative salt-induced outer membrane protein YdiY
VSVLLVALLAAGYLGSARAEEPPGSDWSPTSEYQGKFDWVQMNSGEWVKGEIIVMYDDDLEFDSDEFDDLVLGWDDIRQIHSSQVMNVGLLGQRSAVGFLIVDGDRVQVVGEDGTVREFTKREVLTLTAGAPKEINFWAMKVFFGIIVRTGNSDVRETNVQASFKRRTIENRIVLDFVGNQNTTDGLRVSDNTRANIAWDKFVSDRFFVKPIFGEYYRDPFQNIKRRITAGVGVGYQLMDGAKVDWQVSGGPAYQDTRFESVSAGQDSQVDTPAFTLGTTADWKITSWLEFDGQYRAQFVNEASGTYNHHLVASFETDITKLIDFDVSWIWDRIQDPQPDQNEITPEQDDFRTTVGLTFEF